MIYLGDKLDVLKWYSDNTVCWLGVKIKGRYTTSNKNGYSCGKTYCNYCIGKSKRRSGLSEQFTNLFTAKLLNELINAKPQRLLDIVEDLSKKYVALGKSIDDFNDECTKLLVDSGYINRFLEDKWNYELAKKIDSHTCSYCNREYIFVYKNKIKGKGIVPQFDHWFSKTDYPLLALSFYNLVPSCATCNSIKSASKFDLMNHLHPYLDRNISSSYSFSFLSTSTTSNKIILRNKSTFNTKGLGTAEALNLPLIYEGHSSRELQDLIDLKYKYSKSYLNTLLENTFVGLELHDQEKYRLIFGIEIDEEHYHKRIFSKFKKDIIDELLSIDN